MSVTNAVSGPSPDPNLPTTLLLVLLLLLRARLPRLAGLTAVGGMVLAIAQHSIRVAPGLACMHAMLCQVLASGGVLPRSLADGCAFAAVFVSALHIAEHSRA
jgi:hypothetical protein